MAISEDLGQKIEEMETQGFSHSQIANTLKVSKSYVGKYLRGEVKILLGEGNKSTTERPQTTTEGSKDYLNEQLSLFKQQIQGEFIGIKADILEYIKEEMPLSKDDLSLIKKDNKSLFGKLEFIKKVLKKVDVTAYNEVIEGFKSIDKELKGVGVNE